MSSRTVQSKEAADYDDRKGRAGHHCSVCEYWIGQQGAKRYTSGSCEIVAGRIEAWGGCRLFERFKGGHE